MQYRKLGKWGLRLSEIGLGSWLTYGGAVEDEVARKLVHHAFDNGINFFDTANIYHKGKSELAVGRALKDIRRDGVVLATKLYFPMDDGPNDRGLCRKHIFEQCHASLQRLQTDYIDLYQCHRPDPDTPIEETVMAMGDLVRQGKILYWGVSEWRAHEIAEACAVARREHVYPPVSNQPIYNILERYIEDQVLPVCEREGLGQVVFSPLSQGVLTGKYKPGQPPPAGSRAADDNQNMFMGDVMKQDVLEKVELLKPIAEQAGISMPRMALAWCLRNAGVTSVIVGATKTDQLDENIQAVGVTLSEDTLSAIDKALAE